MHNSLYNATECRDGLFGPAVWTEGCRGGYDFTLAFEETLLTIAPSAAFLLLAGPRSIYLFQSKDKAKRRATYTWKLIASSVYAALQVILLALVASAKQLNTRFSIASAVLNLLAACCVVLLAHIEHVKSIRPSFILSAYLFTSLLFDAARLRTEWLISVNTAYAAVLSASAAVKLAVLSLETVEKRRILVQTQKEPSKESTSGPFSRGFFVWLNSLLLSGWATVLTNSELPAIYEKLSSERLAVKFGETWDKATQKSKKPSLFLTTLKVLKWELLGIAPSRLAVIGLNISQPFLINNALRFLTMPESESTTNLGYALIGAFGLVFVGSAILTAWYEHLTFRAGAMVRGGIITLVYRKMLRLPVKDLKESSAVSLMGNDVETLAEKLNSLLVEFWANVVTVAIAIWMLYAQLGVVCVAPIIMSSFALVLSTAVSGQMVGRVGLYQAATQRRINFISEVLGSMKAVKMLGFTERFRIIAEKKREEDLDAGKHFRWLIVWANCITSSNSSLAQAATFGAYAIVAHLGNKEPFSAAQAITALSILNVLMTPLDYLHGNISSSFAAIGCFRRIEEFLYLEERIDSRDIREGQGCKRPVLSTATASLDGEAVELQTFGRVYSDAADVVIVDGHFNWGEAAVLANINTTFKRSQRGSLTMIVGPIGSGKSSLLQAILGETPAVQGMVSLDSPEVAFCDQTPWLMNATIRDNIVAESRGFDDAWLKTVIEACDLSIDFARLPDGDQTIVGDNGLKLSGGQKQRLAIARAIYSRKSVAIFDDVFSGLDKTTEQTVFTRVFGINGLLRKNGTTAILATHAVNRLPESDCVIALGRGGAVVEQGQFQSLRRAGGYVQSLDVKDALEHNDDTDTNAEQNMADQADRMKAEAAKADEMVLPGDRIIFKYYFAAVGLFNLALLTALTMGYGFVSTFRSVWITWWGNGRGRASTDIGYWLGVYTTLAVLRGVVLTVAVIQMLIVLAPTGGKNLHRRVLNAAMNAPMSFLSNTDTGTLVNRFSQDMRLVDFVLPLSTALFLFEIMACIGAAGLASAAVSWFAIAIPFVGAVLVLVQRFYVRTSKQLRLLEIEHKAPLYSHFLESIHGLTTIRAFGWTRQYIEKNLNLLDDAQKPSYLLNCIQRWLTLVLDLVVACLTILLVVFAVVLRGRIDPSLLGIALVNMMGLGTNMKGIILQWSTLETSLGAVARIKDFSENTPSEHLPGEDRAPQGDWLAQGTLELNNVAVQYDATAGPILRNITLTVKHGEKIGLCGRSGSGKSSLIQALLRMADIAEGEMLLDGENITEVPRPLIRQKLSCLTQDPFLFTDTMRFNADPVSEHSDDEIISALERVGLWSIIMAKVGQGKQPLDERMDANFLSHGQRQLFCLARALLKKSSILVLDEPTSSVDGETDAKIQEVIRSEFKNRTIIMIAHRLDTLLDFDKIAMLEKGLLVEFAAPAELLKDEDGVFAKLYYGDKVGKRFGDMQ